MSTEIDPLVGIITHGNLMGNDAPKTPTSNRLTNMKKGQLMSTVLFGTTLGLYILSQRAKVNIRK